MLDQEGFFSTNDWGDLSDLGWNHIGRTDRITKIKGKRVSLDLVESLIDATDLLSEIAVDSIEVGEETRLGCILLVWKEKLDLAEFLEKERIPKLPNGKPDYKEVRSLLKAQSDSV